MLREFGPSVAMALQKQNMNRKRAEYGFGEHGFKQQAQRVFVGPHRVPDIEREREISSFQPSICVLSELTELVVELTEFAAELTEFLSSETVLTKQHSLFL